MSFAVTQDTGQSGIIPMAKSLSEISTLGQEGPIDFMTGLRFLFLGRDRRLKFGHALEDATADGVLGNQGEEPLDQIEPRRRGRDEVQFEALVPLQPVLHLLAP